MKMKFTLSFLFPFATLISIINQFRLYTHHSNLLILVVKVLVEFRFVSEKKGVTKPILTDLSLQVLQMSKSKNTPT